jgi:hypothetical protein
MNVTLHIGIPKTGSSFLQEWLTINAGSVRSLPVEYSTRLAVECCDTADFADRSDFGVINRTTLSSVVAGLDALANGASDPVVLSSEYFYLARPAAIRDIFASLGLRVVKVLCFLRRQDDLLASGYAQDVKALDRTEPFDLATCRDQYDWLQLQSDYRAAFPDADFVALEFEHLRRSGTLLARWKAELGCTAPTVDVIPGGDLVNASLPGELVEVCRAANRLGNAALADFALAAARRGIATGRCRIPSEAQRAVRARYAASNDRFVAALRDPAGFERYTSAHWTIDEQDVSSLLSPDMVAELLIFALSNRRIATLPADPGANVEQLVLPALPPRLHGHGMRGR